MEDCRSCANYWDQPQRTYLHPILIEYVTDASNELTKNFGHVNLTMGVPIESYHLIYINYASRFDSYAPTRGSIYKPINEARTNEILKRLNNVYYLEEITRNKVDLDSFGTSSKVFPHSS